MNDILFWVATIFSALLAIYAVSDLFKSEDEPIHYKITMTFVILLLPVLGAVIYFKQKYEMAAKPKNQNVVADLNLTQFAGTIEIMTATS